MATIDKRTLKAYIRYDGMGRLVPTSLVLRKNMPKVGKWIEVPAYRCCNPTTTTTTSNTTAPPPDCISYGYVAGAAGGYILYTDCNGSRAEITIKPSQRGSFCAQENELEVYGDMEVTNNGECTTTTTTTTAAPTTSTTTSTSSTTTTTTTTAPTTTTTTTGG